MKPSTHIHLGHEYPLNEFVKEHAEAKLREQFDFWRNGLNKYHPKVVNIVEIPIKTEYDHDVVRISLEQDLNYPIERMWSFA
jgi:hypothetical protein